MRPAGLRVFIGVTPCLVGACIPVEPEWVVTDARFRGVKVEVVEPGGYASLLNVPEGEYRATALPLDTVELTWNVTAPEGELPPPIWLACSSECLGFGARLAIDLASLEDCPVPLPLSPARTCRLGEGWQIRVGLGGAFSASADFSFYVPLVIIGSRRADLAPATCLEFLTSDPVPAAGSCLFTREGIQFGPQWVVLPFDSDSVIPQEIREQDVDINPRISGFAVTRARGGTRIELVADLGDDVPVRRGERITVEPIFTAGSAQSYYILINGDKDVPWSGEPSLQNELLEWRGWFSAPIDGYELVDGELWFTDLKWTVPHDVVPTTLYVDARDNRGGSDFAELRFVADGSEP
ncbi:hypothetical protein [Nannocystis radixulma]|uniref:Carboxypeptidase regulatory-like domain-containing protein n=1 Tax=Nannocystis radixulma TaxID=2995305 RepID=A0ABT5B397_9BACT|nr:hypothetical protein [Nannocystis radixulma]MDC0668565.1 hypothetical protein [Nannocystis radixulma]